MDTLFTTYHSHKDINEYLKYVSRRYPSLVTVFTAGYSYQGRELKGIIIHKNESKSKFANFPKRLDSHSEKSIVFIDGGMHAREWLTISVALYCIYQLTDQCDKYSKLLDSLNFIIMPLVNADGYEYSRMGYKNRMWRKTRRPVHGGEHMGTDCNRNFDSHWNEANANPRRVTYRGSTPFSEPETKAVKIIMESIQMSCKMYITLHSHAQSIMYPWGYTTDLPPNWVDLHEMACTCSDAINRKFGRHYHCGSIAKVIKYKAPGGSADFAMEKIRIPYVYAIELTGNGHGFATPPDEINSLCLEIWIGMKSMFNRIAHLYPMMSSLKV